MPSVSLGAGRRFSAFIDAIHQGYDVVTLDAEVVRNA